MPSRLSRLLALTPRELLVLIAIFAASLPAVTPRIYASDEIQYFSYLRSLWFDHDVSFENEYRHFFDRQIGRGEGFHATFLELQTDTGRRPNFATMGAALLWTPFYAVADVSARLMPTTGQDSVADGFSPPYVAAVAYGSAVYGFLALVLAASVARQVLTPGPDGPGTDAAPPSDHSVPAAVLVWLGTPLLFYMYVAPPYAHACSAFAVALFVFTWIRVRRTWSTRGVVLLGLSAALMGMVREQDLFFALAPALDFILTSVEAVRRHCATPGSRIGLALAGCAAFLAGYLPQLLAYWSLNGYPGPSKLVARKMIWWSPHALQVLGSPEHGFFLWTPLAVLALGGLAWLAWRLRGDRRRLAALLLLMFAMQVYVSGAVDSWSVAGAFGQRRLVAVTVLLTTGLSVVLGAAKGAAARGALAVALAACVWWNLGLTAAFGTGLMNRQRLELRRNAYAAFVTIPTMAPSLAARYLTNRDSFYQRKE